MIDVDVRDLTLFSSATRALLTTCSECASVMLWQFHASPRSLGQWEHDEKLSFLDDPIEVAVLWDEPGRDVLETHNNEKDAKEYGAYAVAIAIADRLGFKVLARTHQGSGTDWLMIRKGEPATDYYKLEVSGMGRINKEKPEIRLRSKINQGSGGDMQRPGVAVVARFEDLRIVSETWV